MALFFKRINFKLIYNTCDFNNEHEIVEMRAKAATTEIIIFIYLLIIKIVKNFIKVIFLFFL